MSGKDDVERMIGRRVERMGGIWIAGFVLVVAATWFGVWVGFTYYPWAYPMTSGLYAFFVLFVIEAVGFIFIWKICNEKPANP